MEAFDLAVVWGPIAANAFVGGAGGGQGVTSEPGFVGRPMVGEYTAVGESGGRGRIGEVLRRKQSAARYVVVARRGNGALLRCLIRRVAASPQPGRPACTGRFLRTPAGGRRWPSA